MSNAAERIPEELFVFLDDEGGDEGVGRGRLGEAHHARRAWREGSIKCTICTLDFYTLNSLLSSKRDELTIYIRTG